MKKASYTILLFLLVVGAFLAGSRYNRETVTPRAGGALIPSTTRTTPHSSPTR